LPLGWQTGPHAGRKPGHQDRQQRLLGQEERDNVKVEVNRSSIGQIVSSKTSKTQSQTQSQTQAKKSEDKDEESNG